MFALAKTILVTSNRLCPLLTNIAANFHILAKQPITSTPHIVLLKPKVPSLVPNCGFKVVGKCSKRCKDCYFVRREERLYVLCKTHPRHKQMSMVKKPRIHGFCHMLHSLKLGHGKEFLYV